MSCCISVFKVLLPIFIAFGIYASLNAFNPSNFEEFEKLIHKQGGQFFKTKGQRVIQYFEFGAPKEESKHTFMILHGAMTTGELWKIHDKWAKERNIRLISPTLPGWGLSTSISIEQSSVQEWTEKDISEFIEYLGFNEKNQFHLVAASLGSIYGASLASHHKSVKDVMLYVAFAPKSPENDPLDGSQLKVFSDMHQYRTFARIFEKYLVIPMLTSFMPPEISSSIKNQWEGLWMCTDDIYSEWKFNWKNISQNRRVFIVSASKDKNAPPQNQKILAQNIKGSILIEYEGEHEDGITKPELMQSHMERLIQ